MYVCVCVSDSECHNGWFLRGFRGIGVDWPDWISLA